MATTYGRYYSPSSTGMAGAVRARTMGNLIDPNDPIYSGGVTQVPDDPSSGGQSLAERQAAWDAEYRALPPGGTMNRQRPGTEGSVDPRDADPASGYGPGGVANPEYRAPNIPGPAAPPPPGLAKRSYQGGPLAYYGVGNIDGTEDIFRRRGTAGALTGFNEQGWGTGGRGTMSIKNVNGAIFSRYGAKPSSIDMVLADPDFQALFPNAKKVGFDKIDYGDGKPVDVLKNADPTTDTAEAWAWQPEDDIVPHGAGSAAAADWSSGRYNTTQPVGQPEPMSASDAIDPDAGYRGVSMRDWLRGEP